MSSSPEPTPTEVRALAIGGLIIEWAFLAWETRAEWKIAIPALLLMHLVGLAGLGLYRVAVHRWRRRTTIEGVLLSSGLFAASVAGAVTYAGGEWMGVRSVLGSIVGGTIVGITLVLMRLAIWGTPAGPDSEPSGPA